MDEKIKVRLVRESSGFGYSAEVANWLPQSPENPVLLKDFRDGKAVELPKFVAANLYNSVNVATGELASSFHSIVLTKEEIKAKYQEVKQEEVKPSTKEPSIYKSELKSKEK